MKAGGNWRPHPVSARFYMMVGAENMFDVFFADIAAAAVSPSPFARAAANAEDNVHLLCCPYRIILIQHLYPIFLAVKDESQEFSRTIPYLLTLFHTMQIYSILNLVVFLFILQEGEVLEKVGMRIQNASRRKPEGKH